MKDCKDCKYFEGYDYDDGSPYCSYNDEACPYNVEGCAKEDEFKITLDIPEITGFIKHTIHDGNNGLLDYLYNCPICHEFICYATELSIEEKFAYCPSCGQALDWSNESEELL